MLRRKFLLVLGSLVGLLMATAILATVLLHEVLKDLDQLGTRAVEGATLVLRLGSDCAALQTELGRPAGQLRPGVPPVIGAPWPPQPPLDTAPSLTDRIAAMNEAARQLAQLELIRRHDETNASGRLAVLLQELRISLGGAPTLGAAPEQARGALLAALPSIQVKIAALDESLHHGLEEERARVVYRFRLIALGIGLVFLLVVNMSVVAVSRLMSIVLRPVERLVEASRRLAREEFTHRVQLDGTDEFDELGRAFNSLAEQLQTNEQRKIETMHQVARTLSHEVNNALSIIELQLSLLARGTPPAQTLPRADLPPPGPQAAQPVTSQPHAAAPSPLQAERLDQIRQSLGRINRTVEALTRVRRIVLTDYLAGVSMLDLERSVDEEPARNARPLTPGIIR
jgi:signal transduction histidine kinase